MENQGRSKLLGEMPMKQLVPKISVPIMISMLVQALYNVVDSIFVAKYNADALTAVSLAFPVQTLMIALSVGLGVGINSLISRRLGEHNHEAAINGAWAGLLMEFIGFVLFALFGAIFSRAFFTWFTTDEQLIELGQQYLSVVTIYSLGLFLSISFERMLQSTGNTVYSMVMQLTGAIVNIILDPIMIFGLLGCPAMGISGAAIATVIGQFCGLGVGIVCNQLKNRELRLSLHGFRIHPRAVKDILAVGFPSMIMQSISSVLTVLMNMILIAYGNVAVSVLGVYFKLQSFVFMPVFGLNNGLVAIVGYNFGARLRQRVYEAIRVALIYAVIIMAVGTVLFLVCPEFLLSLFEAEGESAGELTAIGVPALRTICTHFRHRRHWHYPEHGVPGHRQGLLQPAHEPDAPAHRAAACGVDSLRAGRAERHLVELPHCGDCFPDPVPDSVPAGGPGHPETPGGLSKHTKRAVPLVFSSRTALLYCCKRRAFSSRNTKEEPSHILACKSTNKYGHRRFSKGRAESPLVAPAGAKPSAPASMHGTPYKKCWSKMPCQHDERAVPPVFSSRTAPFSWHHQPI